VRLAFAGTPDTALPSLAALAASDHEIVAVVTRPDTRRGRGRTLHPSPVAEWAAVRGIEVLKPQRADDPDFLAHLASLDIDCFPVVAYGALLKDRALALGTYGWVNLHFSVLPAWRGAAPVQRSIMAGDEVTGATVFSIVRELDAGPVLGQITERIRHDDTAGTLLTRLAQEGSRLLVDVLDHVEELSPIPQPEDGVSYAHKLTVDDAHVDWTRPAFAVDRQIRGCTPAPGAWTMRDDLRLKLGPVTVVESTELSPGEIAISKREVKVGTATNDVVLGEVQPHGKKPMQAADWARGVTWTDAAAFS